MVFRMVLRGLAGAVLLSAPVTAQSVREAAGTLTDRFGSVRAEIDGEPAEDVLREALVEFGELENPPDRANLLRQVTGEIAVQLDDAEAEQDDALALYILETYLPFWLPHLGERERQNRIERYLALSRSVLEHDRNWIHQSGIPVFYTQLVAAGLHDAASTVADAHFRHLDQVLAGLSGADRLDFLTQSRRHAGEMARDEAERQYRADAADLLLANPDWYLGGPVLDWHAAWGPEERDLAGALMAGLPEERLNDAISLPFLDGRRILALRLRVADGSVLPGEAIEQVWRRPYAERRRGIDDAADLADALVRDLHRAGDTDAAIDLLVTYQSLMLESSGVRLVELWGELGDCARAGAATRLAVHADSRPDRAMLMLMRGEDDAAWEEWANVDSHAFGQTNMLRHSQGGWRPRMGAQLLACDRPGFARTALDIQTSGAPNPWQQFYEVDTNWLALWATVETESGRRAVETALWLYRPGQEGWYDEDVSPLLPLLRLERGDRLRDRLLVIGLMLRGMPETDRAVWGPIYRAVIWNNVDDLDTDYRLASLLLLAATMPD
ncbi:hypothetical protein [uncultured Maricaulis sp.]|uniref:hypothetical protein n=1 Tax=uncultured Maricaulis sp. TaxID=174710 RepID=UPI00260DE01A|nr:hypothetical protein [uncultured Maricaulis sp.]